MAQPSKTVLFLGRLDPDTGYDYCLDLCQKLNFKLIVAGGNVKNPEKLFPKCDYVFATGYLSILESFKNKKIVLSYYDNPVKKDYLLMHPMSKYLILDENFPDKLPDEPYQWAKLQTWEKLTDMYEKLWQK